MAVLKHGLKPKRGMVLAFHAGTCELADIRARVIDVWSCLPSGDYLGTLEYTSSVRLGRQLVRQIEACASELYQPHAGPVCLIPALHTTGDPGQRVDQGSGAPPRQHAGLRSGGRATMPGTEATEHRPGLRAEQYAISVLNRQQMSVTPGPSTAELAKCCADETAKFMQQLNHDPQFCFELLRRALAEQSADAFTYVYHIYERLVISWVYRHSQFALTGESAEYFANTALKSFYFALRGQKFDQFPTLAAALRYLKTCVHTAIAQYVRDHTRTQTLPLAEAGELAELADPGQGVEAQEVWARILRLLPDERDQLLARCVFALGLKPREICVAYRTYWSSERSVTLDLYRIRRLLRSDPELRASTGVPLDSTAPDEGVEHDTGS